MSDETKQIFTIELTSKKPMSGIITDNLSGETFKFDKAGLILDFLTKKSKKTEAVDCGCGCSIQKTETAEPEVNAENSLCSAKIVDAIDPQECKKTEEAKPEKKDEEKLKIVKDIEMPNRKRIKDELKKISNFTEDELSIMGWSSMYKAYSLMIRYGQKGVEDGFRKEPWFDKEMKIKLKEKEREEKKNKKKGKDSAKPDKDVKKEAKKQERENRRAEKEKQRADKKAKKEK